MDLNGHSTCQPPAPKTKTAKTAADVCLREIKEWCSPGSPAGHVDGIGFDLIYFLAKFPGWDLDNDGKANDGLAFDGRRFFLEGVYNLTQVATLFFRDKINLRKTVYFIDIFLVPFCEGKKDKRSKLAKGRSIVDT